MRKKPKCAKYRHLTVARSRKGTPAIYYFKTRAKKRIRISTSTDDWDEAVGWKIRFEEGEVTRRNSELPTFTEAAGDFLKHGMEGLAKTTQDDYRSILRPNGPLLSWFGGMRVDEIRRGDCARWWEKAVEKAGASPKTGRNHLNAMASALARADDFHELYDDRPDPVAAFRRSLRRRQNTQAARVARDRPREVRRPLAGAEVEAFVKASEEIARTGPRTARDGHLLDMLLLDTGMRPEEATALRWGAINLEDRKLVVREAFARSIHLGPPKSGRSREVELSRRLIALLRTRQSETADTSPEAFLFPARTAQRRERGLPGIDQNTYRRRHFARVCERAKIGHRRIYDLRHTYASQLLTCGVQPAFISQQLGHANTQITLDTYAKWAEAEYRKPIEPRQGEVAADLLSRLRDGERRRQLRVVEGG